MSKEFRGNGPTVYLDRWTSDDLSLTVPQPDGVQVGDIVFCLIRWYGWVGGRPLQFTSAAGNPMTNTLFSLSPDPPLSDLNYYSGWPGGDTMWTETRAYLSMFVVPEGGVGLPFTYGWINAYAVEFEVHLAAHCFAFAPAENLPFVLGSEADEVNTYHPPSNGFEHTAPDSLTSDFPQAFKLNNYVRGKYRNGPTVVNPDPEQLGFREALFIDFAVNALDKSTPESRIGLTPTSIYDSQHLPELVDAHGFDEIYTNIPYDIHVSTPDFFHSDGSTHRKWTPTTRVLAKWVNSIDPVPLPEWNARQGTDLVPPDNYTNSQALAGYTIVYTDNYGDPAFNALSTGWKVGFIDTGTSSIGTPGVGAWDVSFGYTGGPQLWTVPHDIHRIVVDATGAAGCDSPQGKIGGKGDRIIVIMDVEPGQVFEITVGGKGQMGTGDTVGPPFNITRGGYNWGGDGMGGASSGGGFTGFRRIAEEIVVDGDTITRYRVAAAGGAAASESFDARADTLLDSAYPLTPTRPVGFEILWPTTLTHQGEFLASVHGGGGGPNGGLRPSFGGGWFDLGFRNGVTRHGEFWGNNDDPSTDIPPDPDWYRDRDFKIRLVEFFRGFNASNNGALNIRYIRP